MIPIMIKEAIMSRMTFQAISNKKPSPIALATHSPIWPPKIMSITETMAKRERETVRPSDRSWIFHQGRFSSTSYALFKAAAMFATAREAAQRVAINPTERSPPRWS